MFRKTFDQYMVNTYVFYLTLFRNLIFKLKEPILILIGMFIICIVFSILINKIEKLIKKFSIGQIKHTYYFQKLLNSYYK